MLEVVRLTKAGQLTKATAMLQNKLGARARATQATHAPNATPATDTGAEIQVLPHAATPSKLLRKALLPFGETGRSKKFLDCTFTNQAGSRPYKLYVPSGYHGQPVPLIVMMHGCTQSPEDFAAGTRMNIVAEEQDFLVAYPAQTSAANMQKCWNWFRTADQQRDAGEPSLIAGITREIMRGYAVDRQRIYIAGLSAGGAASAIMGQTYPDLYAAIGVHSGLACGAARDMPSAFAAMKNGNSTEPTPKHGHSAAGAQRIVPAIVFHGDRDTTVNPGNADAVVAQAARAASLTRSIEKGQVPGGLGYTRSVYSTAGGDSVVEQWLVHGAGHAWSGGSPAGSFTLPRGPNATREMVRFFLENRQPKVSF
jgi:poly(hydroxyalkanoate) depolymerase family esterase